MKLLVSVVDAGEARAAAAAGADVVDVKNPAEGSLGAPSPAVIAAVRAAVPPTCRSAPRSATCPTCPGTAALAALGAARSGATFVKVGLWGVATEAEAVALLRAVRDGVAVVRARWWWPPPTRTPGAWRCAAGAGAAAAGRARGGRRRLPARHGGQGRPRAPGLARRPTRSRHWWPRPMPWVCRWRWRRPARRGPAGGPRRRRRHRRRALGRCRDGGAPGPSRRRASVPCARRARYAGAASP